MRGPLAGCSRVFEVHRAHCVHPLMPQDHAILLADDLERRAGRAPDAADRDRIAAERRIVLERVVSRDGRFARRRQEIHHRLRPARAVAARIRRRARIRREQPRAEDVRAGRQSVRSGCARLCAARAVDAECSAVREVDVVEEAHRRAMPRQRAVDAQLRAGLQHLRRNAVARELSEAVRFADVLLRLAVLVDGRDVQVAVRIARFVLGDRARDVHGLVRVEVRREAVMRIGRSREQAERARAAVRVFIVASLVPPKTFAKYRPGPSRSTVNFASVPR